MEVINFTVPGKAKPKQSVRGGRHGFYRDPKITAHQNLIKKHFVEKVGSEFEPFAGPVEIVVTFYMDPSKKAHALMTNGLYPCTHKNRGDTDNLVKCVKDALNGLAYDDDSQVWRDRLEKVYDTGGARTEISIIKTPSSEFDKGYFRV